METDDARRIMQHRAQETAPMPTIMDFLQPKTLERLAKPADARLGLAIVADKGVTLTILEAEHVRATVGGVPASPQWRTVELTWSATGVTWSCTCTRHRECFCKHCVATVVAAWQAMPGVEPIRSSL
ncbi:hypothetical protein [Burkholderia pseudomallei]|uniref:hypothetical protein n=1 Tax=Burkholderia pseudomallei TaxID=28450 RepID=UPI0012B1F927|nr:hypothetical protein [Burkholderia pseudomallei]